MNPPIESREALVGWRGWHIALPHYLVTGSSPATVWLPNEPTEAICRVHRHARKHYINHERIPADGCSCGIYAFKAPYKLRTDDYLNQDMYGEVWLWGKVIEHSMGYKAEYAYPKALYFPDMEARNAFNRYSTTFAHKDQWDTARMEAEMIAFRYGIPFTVIGVGHPIYTKTKEEQEAEAKKRALDAAERARKAMGTRAYTQKLKEAAMKMPSKHPHLYKSLWDEIEATAAIQAATKNQRKP